MSGQHTSEESQSSREITPFKEAQKQKVSDFQIGEYYSKRMSEIEADLRAQGTKGRALKKAMKKARKDVRAEIQLNFVKMTRKDAKAWLAEKETELKAQHPEMKDGDIKVMAYSAYQETFGANPPQNLFKKVLLACTPIIGMVKHFVDKRDIRVAEEKYHMAHLNPQQSELMKLGIPLELVVADSDAKIMEFAQKRNINLPPKNN